jgi:hypothetical protein
MVPLLVQAGHAVVGLDSDLFEHCTFCPGTFDVWSCEAIFAASRPAIWTVSMPSAISPRCRTIRSAI